jgi:sterol desaturase/sphingolipid hydroxylase (fatty acid hydroxylase superfamily)
VALPERPQAAPRIPRHHVYASEYFGVVDFMLNILPGVLPALLLRSHLAVVLLFTALRQWQTVQSHSGYDLPFDPFNRGPFHGGSRRHDFHHSHNSGCYSDFLPFWDWLCSTDGHYRAYWLKHADVAAY